ncbi:MAG: hypothetical protein JO355_10905 [Planctomycetaceae bacterium]|nr:hypothetical protein [Planctomycetaceae bacterium]MBV8677658.1 hypothetical protein [Planctomycetaceae bacterium]
MRLWHLVFGILVIAIALSVARGPADRVAPIVFRTGTGEVVVGTMVVPALFQTPAQSTGPRGCRPTSGCRRRPRWCWRWPRSSWPACCSSAFG